MKTRLQRTLRAMAREAVEIAVLFAFTVYSVAPSYAQTLQADTSAPAANRPGLDTAPNGVPIVNIVQPNDAGVSHNLFTHYNVGTKGLILNNSPLLGKSKLAGQILGNPNLRACS